MRLAAALVLALLAPLPAARAEVPPAIHDAWTPTPTTLYFHVLDDIQEFAINTQPPPSAFQASSRVIASATVTCLGLPSEVGASQSDFNTLFGHLASGPMNYDYKDDQGRSQPQPYFERGLAYTLALDRGNHPVLHWSLATTLGAAGAEAAGQVLVVPDVAVHAWVRTGEAISISDDAYKAGDLIAEGETVGNLAGPLATSATSPTGSVAYSTVTGPSGQTLAVYDYTIPLDLRMDRIPAPGGFNVQVATFLKTDSCPNPRDASVMPDVVKVHSSDGHRPRLELAVLNPVRITYIHPVRVYDVAVFHVAVNSPWGSYDVVDPVAAADNRTDNVRLEVVGPDGPVTGLYRAALPQRFHEHGHSYSLDGADVAFVWPYGEVGAPEGTYDVHLVVANVQGTAKAEATTFVRLGEPFETVQCGGLTQDVLDRNATVTPVCTPAATDKNGNLVDPARRASGIQVVGALAALFALARRRA